MDAITTIHRTIHQLQLTLLIVLLWIHNTRSQIYSSYDLFKDKNPTPPPQGAAGPKEPGCCPGQPLDPHYGTGINLNQYPSGPLPEVPPGNDNYNYHGNYDNYYGGGVWSYDYKDFEPDPPVLECYTCHYSKHKHYEQGHPNCDEPFRDEGIPTVTCQGLCAKTRTLLGSDGEEYMLIRSCLPNCKDIIDPLSSTEVQCCYGELCNGAINGSSKLDVTRALLVVLTLWVVIFLVSVDL